MALDIHKTITVDGSQPVQTLKDLLEAQQKLTAELSKTSAGTDTYTKALNELSTVVSKLNKVTDTHVEKPKALAGSYAALEEQMRGLRKAWKEATDDVTRAGLEKKIGEVSEKMRALDTSMKQNKRNGEALEGSYNGLVKRMAELTREFRSTTDAARRADLAKEIKKVNDQLKEMDASRGIFGRKVGSYFESIKDGLLRVVAPAALAAKTINLLAKGIREVININVDFEKENSRLAAVIGKSREEIGYLTQSALDLGKVTVATASEVTQLQIELAKLGFKDSDIFNMQEGVLKFATVLGTNLADAAEFTGSVLRTFNLTSADTKDVVDSLTNATFNSSLNFDKLKVAMSYVGPQAKAMGLDLNDALALIGTLINQGFSAEKAGTGVRKILVELSKAGSKATSVLGYQAKSFDDVIRAMRDLEKSGYNVGAMFKIFGDRGGTAAVAMRNNIEAATKLREVLEESAGSTNEAYEEMTKNVAGALKRLQSAWQDFILAVNDSTGVLRKVLLTLADSIISIKQLFFPDSKVNDQSEAAFKDLKKRIEDTEDAVKKSYKQREELGESFTKGEKKRAIEQAKADQMATYSEELDASIKKREHELENLAEQETAYANITAKERRKQRKETGFDIDAEEKRIKALKKTKEYELNVLKQTQEKYELWYSAEAMKASPEEITFDTDYSGGDKQSQKRKQRYNALLKEVDSQLKVQKAYNKAYIQDIEKREAEDERVTKEAQEKKLDILKDWKKEAADNAAELADVEARIAEATNNEIIAGYERVYNTRTKLTKKAERDLNTTLANITKSLQTQVKSITDKYTKQEQGTVGKGGSGSFIERLFGFSRLSPEQIQAETDEVYNAEMAALQQQLSAYQTVIDNENLTDEARTRAMQQQALIRQRIAQTEQEHTVKTAENTIAQINKERQSYFDLAAGVADVMGTIADIEQESIRRKLESGAITEEQAEKEFEATKALQYAQTWINTLSGMMLAFADPIVNTSGWVGWAAAAAKAAGVLATGIANTTQIANTTLGSKASSSSASAPKVQSTMSYTRSITGASEEERLNRMADDQRVILVWDDVEAFDKHKKVQIQETDF